jgi:hypothetical protein
VHKFSSNAITVSLGQQYEFENMIYGAPRGNRRILMNYAQITPFLLHLHEFLARGMPHQFTRRLIKAIFMPNDISAPH